MLGVQARKIAAHDRCQTASSCAIGCFERGGGPQGTEEFVRASQGVG